MSTLDELYAQRRLAIVERAQELTPSMQRDFALSALSNPELEELVGHFNPKPQKEGWGFANVFEEMLSREPRRVPVEDLATLQTNLKNAGYLDPNHPTDGVWGPDSAAAFSQFDRDNADQVRQGNSLMSGTVQDGIRFFGSMLPRSVIQGVIGSAKGIYHQTGETFERGGALGGAAEGAAIGAALGTVGGPLAPLTSTAGAIGGAIIGGIGGFLASLNDNDEKDGNTNEGFMDALSPFNEGEWTTARNFFEDVGYVGTVASSIAGINQVGAGLAKLAPSTLRGSLLALDPVTKPGFVMNMLGSAKGATALGAFAGGAHGLATGDDLGDVFEQAAIGGAAGFAVGASPVGAKLRGIAAKYGLQRVSTNPVVSGINSAFTGGVMANVGGRYLGGLGSGDKETAIEKSIREAPVVIPEWADVLGSMVLLPERLTPLSLGEIGNAARKWVGGVEGVAKRPYFQALEAIRDAAGNLYSKSKIRGIVDNITPEQDLWTREQFGLEQLTKARIETIKAKDAEGWATRTDIEGVFDDEAADIMKWYESNPESHRHIVTAFSTEDPSAYATYLLELEQRKSGITQWGTYAPAQMQAERLAEMAQAGKLPYSAGGKTYEPLEAGAVATATKDKQVTFVAAQDTYMTRKNWTDAADEYVRLNEEAIRATRTAEELGDDVAMVEQRRVAEMAAIDAREKLRQFVRGFSDPNNKQMQLNESFIDMALSGAQTTKKVGKKSVTTYDFAEVLKEKAKHAGLDVELADPEMVTVLTDNGYKLVQTGRNVRHLSDVVKLSELHDVGDYTTRASFFESAGFSPFRLTEKEIGVYKQQNVIGHLNQAAAELGISLPGEQAFGKLMGKIKNINDPSKTGAGQWASFITAPGDASLVSRTRLQIQDLRQLKLDDIVDALALDEGLLTGAADPLRAAQAFKDAIHKGMAFGGEVSVKNPMDSVRMLMSAFRVEGLPGASDFMRQFHFTNPPRALTIAGGVAGAGVGAQEEGLKGALKGGIYGALAMGSASYGGKAFLKKWPNKSPFKPGTYGWLPNNLHNAAMALRYSLSFTFDLGRRMEQASIASMKHGLPGIVAPKSWARRHLAEEFGGSENVMTGLRAQLDEVMGNSHGMNADDIERRATAVGLTGYSQRDADAVYAHLLIKQGKMKPMQVREAVYELGHYLPRTGGERSLNFVLFPFSFQKKMLTTLNDFLLAEPARALLVHEGMRQWYQVRDGADETMSSRFKEYTQKYLPIADQVARLNNLSYGLSPGRFWMEGIVNNKTLNAKIAESLAAVFVPGGSLTPLHQAAGSAGDQMVHLFTPIFLTGEDTENFASIFEDFAPAVRDVRNIFLGRGANQPSIMSQQVTALTEHGTPGGGGAPWSQLQNFNNERRQLKMEYEDLASAFGYTTVDGFLNSDMGATYKADIEAKTMALVAKYPTGAAKSQYFETSSLLDDKAKAELMEDPHRTPAEEVIAQIIEMENEGAMFADMLGMTSDEMLPKLTSDIRSIASRWGDDARFRELWARFFQYRYGPVAEVVVG
jgi:hypothetical protein